jgi:hypothetical protein
MAKGLGEARQSAVSGLLRKEPLRQIEAWDATGVGAVMALLPTVGL